MGTQRPEGRSLAGRKTSCFCYEALRAADDEVTRWQNPPLPLTADLADIHRHADLPRAKHARQWWEPTVLILVL